jgi:outer membrane protein TolC
MRFYPLILLAIPLAAQDALSLRDAVRLALRENPAIAAADADTRAAKARIAEAHGGALPKVNYTESFTRGDNPVYVFGSLLTQHQFTSTNFALESLNRPDALNNFQSQLAVDQTLYDGGQTRRAVKQAELSHELSVEDQRRARMETIAGAARGYYATLLAAERLKDAEQAKKSAAADLKRAEDVRAAGMSTDADVLSIRVHLAAVDEQRISRAADLDVARAALNQALGVPLDSTHTLSTTLAALDLPDLDPAGLEREAVQFRPEIKQARLGTTLAQTAGESTRAAMLPQVGFHAGFEIDRQRFVTRAGANWIAGVSLRWNLFNGNSDKARIQESGAWLAHATAMEKNANSTVALQVRRAYADLRSAVQRIEVAKAAMAEAEESLRITQNRYGAGMATVTDLLRIETAVLESKTRYLAAVHDQRVAATMLELAAGRLTADSEVLN